MIFKHFHYEPLPTSNVTAIQQNHICKKNKFVYGFPDVSIKRTFYFRERIILHQSALCWVGVGSATAAEGLDNIGEAAVELDTSLGAAGLLLFLLLLLDLRCLSLDLAGTSQRTVHFTSEQWNGQVQFDAAERRDLAVVGQDCSLAREGEVGVDGILEKCQFSLWMEMRSLVSGCCWIEEVVRVSEGEWLFEMIFRQISNYAGNASWIKATCSCSIQENLSFYCELTMICWNLRVKFEP